MRPFHPADVAVLKQGQGAVIGIGKRHREFSAPTHLLTAVHSLTYPLGGGAPAADGPADPFVGVIEGRRDLNKVEHCILYSRARREHGRVPGRRDRDNDDRTRRVEQAVPLSGGLMAENGIRPGAEQRGPEHRLPGGVAGEGGVHAALQPLPAAAAHPAAHYARANASHGGLAAGNGLALGCQHLTGLRGHIGRHASEAAQRNRGPPLALPTCG